MKLINRLKIVLISACLCTLGVAPLISADDTEIFFGQSNDSGTLNPNVLFILDTSGSMTNFDGGNDSRMERMKSAMSVLLRDSSSFNVGLMGFSGSNRGGAIRYPVSNLEEDSGGLCEGGLCPDEKVVVRIDSPSDDASESNDTNVVENWRSWLLMPTSPTGTGAEVIELAPEVTGSAFATSIAAESEVADAEPNTRLITGTTKWFFDGTADSEPDRHAYRFENINIPVGAIVTSASITFTQTDPTAQPGNLSTLIKLEATAEPEPLPNGLNGYPSIGERLVEATRSVQWNNIPPDNSVVEATTDPADPTVVVAPVATDSAVTTSELKSIMNLIVTLPTWKAGNPMSFIFDAVDEYNPSDLDTRSFNGVNAAESLRPVLNYSYAEAVDTAFTTVEHAAVSHLDEITEQTTVPESATPVVSRNLTNTHSRMFFAGAENKPRELAFRFENIAIPANAIITNATLSLTGGTDAEESLAADWIADAGSAPATDSATDPATDPVTNAATDPDPVTLENGAAATAQTSNKSTSGNDSSLNQLNINISAETTGTPLAYATTPVIDRNLTTEFVAWQDVQITPNKTVTSPTLSDVISEVVSGSDWVSGGDLSLVLSSAIGYNNVLANSTMIETAAGTAVPKLYITWQANDETVVEYTDTQTTALRFSDVHIPPSATIKSARIVFNSAKANVRKSVLEISGEKKPVSAPLATVNENISGPERTRTDQKVTWDAEPWSFPNRIYKSADIKDIVQEIVNQTEWCGGNPLTLFIDKSKLPDSGNDDRTAIARDVNLQRSPSLEITYEAGSVPAGAYCSSTTKVVSINSNNDDAAEDNVTNNSPYWGLRLYAAHPQTKNPQTMGMRFTGLAVPKNAVISSATLEMTRSNDFSNKQNYVFKITNTLDTPQFDNTDNKVLDVGRTTFDASVTGTASVGAENTTFITDVSDLITARVSDPDWKPGTAVAITAESQGVVAHEFWAFEGDKARAPKLKVTYQTQRETPGTLFRDNLISIVDGLVAQGGTPIVGSYYEAARYYIGDPVHYGLRRGAKYYSDRYHRVSHPGSYTNGNVWRPDSCTDANLNAYDCRKEIIQSSGGSAPTYASPMDHECQQNHIVLLSDGEPTSNSAKWRVKNLTGDSSCVGSGDGECGTELAKWLYDTDLDSTIDGVQNITTHTIGFNLSTPQFMEDIAAAGGGSYYSASTASQLVNAFRNIFINVSKTDTSFVAPSATVSQSNRLKNREDIYFSLFKPEGTARWAGNLKRYKLGGTVDNTANILDANDAAAIDERTGRFFPNAKSFWSSGIDGDSVLLGGAAEKIESNGVSHTTRKVYTYTGGDKNLTNESANELMPENPNIDLTKLQLPPSLAADTDYVYKLLNWAHGQDVYDIDGDGHTEEARAQMGDPMHSQPLLINYTGGRSVVHVATNEGFLHAVDHDTGEENFAFIPQDLLGILNRNFENQPTSDRPYGLDGGMTSWVDDVNKDGLVDPATDKAYLYIGMRRGGNHYYALDVTDPEEPHYLWSIDGGSGYFVELGETWSKPIKTKIWVEGAERDVLMFGAGYSRNQDARDTGELPPGTVLGSADDTRQTRQYDTVGRGFFIVDAETGAHIWHADYADPDYTDLQYSVPSELRVIDLNFDGLADQIYFGDMGGQVWRFDYNNDQHITESTDNRMEGGRIAQFANDTAEGARRFYYPPDVALLSVGDEQQLSISIGSGWRAHPLDRVVEDRFYSFRMTQVYGVPTTSDGGVRYPEVSEATSSLINLAAPGVEIDRSTDKTESGWYLPLDLGEKVLSSSVTLDGKIVFTSYSPAVAGSACAAAIGSGSVYIIDQATGNPVQNLDDSDEEPDIGAANPDGTDTTTDPRSGGRPLTKNDRKRKTKTSGIPSEVTVMFPELGNASVFAGRDKLDEVEIKELKTRTFWQEHVEDGL